MTGAERLFARVGDSGRVLHLRDCELIPVAQATLMTRTEALSYAAMWGHRPCMVCQPMPALSVHSVRGDS